MKIILWTFVWWFLQIAGQYVDFLTRSQECFNRIYDTPDGTLVLFVIWVLGCIYFRD